MPAILLDHVRQFVGQHCVACVCRWLVLARRKNDIAANSVGVRIHCFRRFARASISVHANLTEIVSETRCTRYSGGEAGATAQVCLRQSGE